MHAQVMQHAPYRTEPSAIPDQGNQLQSLQLGKPGDIVVSVNSPMLPAFPNNQQMADGSAQLVLPSTVRAGMPQAQASTGMMRPMPPAWNAQLEAIRCTQSSNGTQFPRPISIPASQAPHPTGQQQWKIGRGSLPPPCSAMHIASSAASLQPCVKVKDPAEQQSLKDTNQACPALADAAEAACPGSTGMPQACRPGSGLAPVVQQVTGSLASSQPNVPDSSTLQTTVPAASSVAPSHSASSAPQGGSHQEAAASASAAAARPLRGQLPAPAEIEAAHVRNFAAGLRWRIRFNDEPEPLVQPGVRLGPVLCKVEAEWCTRGGGDCSWHSSVLDGREMTLHQLLQLQASDPGQLTSHQAQLVKDCQQVHVGLVNLHDEQHQDNKQQNDTPRIITLPDRLEVGNFPQLN